MGATGATQLPSAVPGWGWRKNGNTPTLLLQATQKGARVLAAQRAAMVVAERRSNFDIRWVSYKSVSLSPASYR